MQCKQCLFNSLSYNTELLNKTQVFFTGRFSVWCLICSAHMQVMQNSDVSLYHRKGEGSPKPNIVYRLIKKWAQNRQNMKLCQVCFSLHRGLVISSVQGSILSETLCAMCTVSMLEYYLLTCCCFVVTLNTNLFSNMPNRGKLPPWNENNQVLQPEFNKGMHPPQDRPLQQDPPWGPHVRVFYSKIHFKLN